MTALGVQGLDPSASWAGFGSEHLSPRCWADCLVLVSFLGRVFVVENAQLMRQTAVLGSAGVRLLGTRSC